MTTAPPIHPNRRVPKHGRIEWTPAVDREIDRCIEGGLSTRAMVDHMTAKFGVGFTGDAIHGRLARRRRAAGPRAIPTQPTETDRRVGTSPAAAPVPPSVSSPEPEFYIPVTLEEPLEDPVERATKRDQAARLRAEVDDLVGQLREARARQRFLDTMADLREPPRVMPRERSGLREMTAVVLASDWHVEETVDPVSVAGRNEYNLAIAEQRIRRFFNSIIWHFEHNRASGRIALRDLVLWLGGDLITGYIHEELLESNALSPTQTIRWLLPLLRNGIATLLEVLGLERIILPCSHGNHGRTTQKTRVSTGAANSFEWLLYWSLADEFRNDPRVVFEITNSAHQYVQVYDWILHFHHGDDVKYQGGVGGIGIPLLKAVPMWDLVRRSDVHHIGHWHQLRDFGRAVVNGSLIGFSPYSLRIRAEFEPPRQALYFIDSKRGKADGIRHLWVDERQDAAA